MVFDIHRHSWNQSPLDTEELLYFLFGEIYNIYSSVYIRIVFERSCKLFELCFWAVEL